MLRASLRRPASNDLYLPLAIASLGCLLGADAGGEIFHGSEHLPNIIQETFIAAKRVSWAIKGFRSGFRSRHFNPFVQI